MDSILAYLNLESLNLKIGRRKKAGKEQEKRQTIKARIRSKKPYIILIPIFLDDTGVYPARLGWRTASHSSPMSLLLCFIHSGMLQPDANTLFHPFRDVAARRQHEGSQDKLVIAGFNVN